MKRFIKYKTIKKILLIVAIATVASLQFTPVKVHAACPGGLDQDSQKHCCNSGEVAVAIDVGSKTTQCCPWNQIKFDATPVCLVSDVCSSHNTTACLYDKYVNPAIQVLSALVGIVVVITIIWGAIQFATSESDPQKVATARKRIVGAIVALALYFVLYALLQFLIPGGLFSGQ